MSQGASSRAQPVAAALLTALLSLGIPGAVAAQAGQGQVSLPLGTPAPDAMVEDLDGNPVSLLSQIPGAGLVEFWATWCELCEALQPQMDRIHAEFGDRLTVVAVAVAVAQSQRRVKRHLDQHDPGYPFLWDAGGEAVRAYEAPTTSVVVLMNEAREIVYTGVGADQDLVGAVEAMFAAAGRH